jgi:PAS domain S-box-containing protein
MPKSKLPENEEERVKFLRELKILDTPADPIFDSITKTLAYIFDAPIVALSLVDSDRQFFKSIVGLDVCGTSRDVSFCSHAILAPQELLIVEDARLDSRFSDNSLVKGQPGIRFYAGAPLTTEDGISLGSLCVIDRKARTCTPEQLQILKDMAKQALFILIAKSKLEACLSFVNTISEQANEIKEYQKHEESMLESVTDYAIIKLDAQGNIKSWNKGAKRIKGYSDEEILGRNFALFHPIDDVIAGKTMRVLSETAEKGCYREKGKRIKKDGSVFYAEVVLTATYDKLGVVEGFIKVTRDISEQVALEQEKAQQDLELRNSLNHTKIYQQALDTNAIVAVTDLGGRIIDVNENFLAISEYTREELIGKTHKIINSGYHPKEFFANLWRTISKGKLWKGQICNKSKSGKLYWVETSIVPLINEAGRIERYVAIRYDITQKKLVENELSKTKQQLEYILESVDAGIVTYDKDDKLMMYNRKYCELYGFKEDELPLGAFYEDIVRQYYTRYPATLEGKTIDVAVSERMIEHRACPKELIQKLNDTAIRINNTKLSDGAIVSLRTNISDLLAIQQAFSDAKTKADLANKSKSDFLAHMSHEIRTPLASIIAATELALDKDVSSEDQKSYLDTIANASDFLLSVVNDVLDLSKIESGHLQLESIPFSLRELVDSVGKLFGERARIRGNKINILVDENVHDMHVGDPTRIKQIVLNFASNAVKFTENGSITISAKVSAESDSSRQSILISVIDNGKGLTTDQQQKLFKNYSQAEISTARVSGGTGLGLAIVKNISKLMGGSIGVKSSYGNGSTFWFSVSLKIADPQIDRHQPAAVSSSSDSSSSCIVQNEKPLSILIAEDDLVNQKLICKFLTKMGHKPQVASNGEDILKLFSCSQFDIIIMDCNMPGMNGFQATAEIRKQGSLIPVIGFTADNTKEIERECKNAGMNDVITKPFKSQVLKDALSRAVYLLQ